MDLPVKADLSSTSNEILKELVLPSAKQVGMALGNVFGLFNTFTLPIRFANEYAQRNFERYSEKLKEIPEEKIKEVEPEIAIPLIDKLSYTSNEDLANAYANLLANASNKDKVDLIHPGFIQKLNNMAPDEARLLEYLKNKSQIPYFLFKAVNSKDNSFIKISVLLTGIEQEMEISIKNMATHIENLVSLNILRDEGESFLVNEKIYEDLKNKYSEIEKEYEQWIKDGLRYPDKDKLDITKSYYSVTQLGRTFINVCTDTAQEKVIVTRAKIDLGIQI